MLESSGLPLVAWSVAFAVVVVALGAVLGRAASALRASASAATVDDLLEVRRRLASATPPSLDRAIVREALGLVEADGATLVHRRGSALVVGHQSRPGLLHDGHLDEGIVGRVANSGRRRSQIVTADPSVAQPSAAVLAVPIVGRGPVDAVLVLQRDPGSPFTATEAATMSAMVAVAADGLVRAGREGAHGFGSRPDLDRDLPVVLTEGETRATITALMIVEPDDVVEVIWTSIRPTDRIYRFDDRALAVLMPDTDLEAACAVAERVGAVAGVSTATGGEPAALVARADEARRAASADGTRVVGRW